LDTIFSKLSITDLWLKIVITFAVCILVGLVLQLVVFYLLKTYNKKKPTVLKTQLLKHLETPVKLLLPILFIYSSFGLFSISKVWHTVIEVIIIVNFTWVLLAMIRAVEEIVKQKFTTNSSHKAKERKAITQMRFIKSASIVVIVTLATATILWNIPAVRTIGTTILTSAGVIGIIAGVAAQKSIANLITGMQIAFTQPIKIDDEVVIEGEFGTVEDITLTYVVVKTWDWRRLVLPLNYFNDHHFINRSFNSPELIGTVFLYVDYTFPVAELRKKCLDIIGENILWDKKVAQLLVTNADAVSVEVRVTFSAKNAASVWDLSCQIREQLITFIQEQFPESLPKIRRDPPIIQKET
jgi:small-conductance mechanosensitive channel